MRGSPRLLTQRSRLETDRKRFPHRFGRVLAFIVDARPLPGQNRPSNDLAARCLTALFTIDCLRKWSNYPTQPTSTPESEFLSDQIVTLADRILSKLDVRILKLARSRYAFARLL